MFKRHQLKACPKSNLNYTFFSVSISETPNQNKHSSCLSSSGNRDEKSNPLIKYAFANKSRMNDKNECERKSFYEKKKKIESAECDCRRRERITLFYSSCVCFVCWTDKMEWKRGKEWEWMETNGFNITHWWIWKYCRWYIDYYRYLCFFFFIVCVQLCTCIMQRFPFPRQPRAPYIIQYICSRNSNRKVSMIPNQIDIRNFYVFIAQSWLLFPHSFIRRRVLLLAPFSLSLQININYLCASESPQDEARKYPKRIQTFLSLI